MNEHTYTAAQSKFQPGVYKHFNGRLYHAIGIAEHETKGERNVVYYDDNGEMWLRSVQSFKAKVNAANYSGLRFVLVKEVNQDRVPFKELVKKGNRETFIASKELVKKGNKELVKKGNKETFIASIELVKKGNMEKI